MGKIKTTKKAIMESYSKVISVGYCDLTYLLRGKYPIAYTSGVYGWNADVYQIDYNTCIVTGYRPFGNIASNEKSGLNTKYNKKARELTSDCLTWEDTQKVLDELLEEYLKELI